MEWQTWVRQSLPRTDYLRGGATCWPVGGSRLLDDALGPTLHLHVGAAEIFYFVAGRCRLEIGDSEEFFGPGDYVLVPPEVPHNLWSADPTTDLLVFWLVAPHFQADKWRTAGFPPGAMQQRAIRGRVEAGTTLPSHPLLDSQLLTLPAGAAQTEHTAEKQEAVLYVVEGEVETQVGHLRGRLGAHQLVHVPVDTPYALACPTGPALVLLIHTPRGAA